MLSIKSVFSAQCILFFSVYSLTLHEIAALLEAPADGDDEENDIRSEDIQEIIKIPPTDGQETDEDSDDENGGNLNHLTSAQLLTECEVVLVSDITCAATEVNEVDSKEKRKRKKVKVKKRNWRDNGNFLGISV